MIKVKNIYYMLSYAFQVLNAQGYQNIATEDFDNTSELFAAILIKGISVQLKRGLAKDYVSRTETLSALRGKMNISGSIKDMTLVRNRMVCTYDDFSENCYKNQIIKSTVLFLIRSSEVSKIRKQQLRKLMIYFDAVDEVEIQHISWNQHYSRNDQNYQMLITVCNLVVKGLIQTQADGTTRMREFLDDQQMYHLYEKFILEYYRKEFPKIKANASQIAWQLDTDEHEFLPVMQSDIMLTYKYKTLIIDAKYYSQTMSLQYDKRILNSANLYQIFTYVKNKEVELSDEPHEVSGMLLYAQTDEKIVPENEYVMSGNKICIRTLNLNSPFSEIRIQLNNIVKKYLLDA